MLARNINATFLRPSCDPSETATGIGAQLQRSNARKESRLALTLENQ
jgi:hypothetical protein